LKSHYFFAEEILKKIISEVIEARRLVFLRRYQFQTLHFKRKEIFMKSDLVKLTGLFFLFAAFMLLPVPLYAGDCNDGVDNDGDGYVDYPDDPDCLSASDDRELNIVLVNEESIGRRLYSIDVQSPMIYVGGDGVIITRHTNNLWMGDTVDYDGRFIDAEGNFLYGIYDEYDQENSLNIYDISDYTSILRLSEYDPTGFFVKGMIAGGNFVYISCYGDGIDVVNVSFPFVPAKVANIPVTGPRELDLVNDYLYIVKYNDGLSIADVSDPSSPTIVGNCTEGAVACKDVKVVGNYAYVTDQYSTAPGIHIIDVSDKSSPQYVKKVGTPGPALAIDIDGDFACVATESSGIQVYYMASPTQMRHAANFPTTDKTVDVRLVGRYAYTVENDDGFRIYDITGDTDGDGMSNAWEDTYSCVSSDISDYAADPDNDYLDNIGEHFAHTNPCNTDTDGDGLSDNNEVNNYGTDPTLADTDGDGLSDYEEIYSYATDPLLSDTDSDGLSDGDEVNIHDTRPEYPDTDDDGLSDGDEVNTYGSDPKDPDTDDDGLSDGDEVNIYGSDPIVVDTDGDGLSDYDEVTIHNTDPTLADSDSDGLTDYDEINVHGSDPNNTDSDSDGLSDGNEVNTHGTDPTDSDTDGDGLSDYDEVNTYSTDPNDPDSDDDGVFDGEEINTYGSDPNDVDTDGDNLTDGDEVNTYGTDPTDPDTDGDGLSDYDEVTIHGTDPTLADSDSDGLSDYDEVNTHGTDPIDSDTDGDGLSDYDEVNTCNTDPNDTDSDDDGVSDGDEVNTHGSDPNNVDSDGDGLSDGDEVNTHGTDPTLTDTDGDGLSDGDEVNSHGTDPTVTDTDGDGLSDYDEVTIHNTDPTLADSDSDGLSDYAEINIHGTDPTDADTDNDGLSDGDEVNTYGSDPHSSDTDGDGIGDGGEVNSHGTDPTLADTDGDGMGDNWEVAHAECVDPLMGDSLEDPDSDGLTNMEESGPGTDPCNADGDGDGLSDGDEVNTHGTDPSLDDTDGDGLGDNWEVTHSACMDPLTKDSQQDYDGDSYTNMEEHDQGTNPCNGDSDGDGLADHDEINIHGTDPLVADTDNDGLNDGDEVNTYGTNPHVVDSDGDGLLDGDEVNTHGTDPDLDDTDDDGLLDGDEVNTHGTDPTLADSDGDGMDDDWEVFHSACMDPLSGDSLQDFDSDGVTNIDEFGQGTSPCNVDTDGDRLDDDWEMQYSSCGFDYTSFSSEIVSYAEIGDDKKISDGNDSSYKPSLVSAESEYGVAWVDSRDSTEEIYFARVSSTGDRTGPEIRISDNSDYLGRQPSLVWTDQNGWMEYAVVYGSYTSKFYFAMFEPDGSYVYADDIITDSGMTYDASALVWTGSDYGISWVDYRDGNDEIYFARRDWLGDKIGSDVRVTNDSYSSTEVSSCWTGSEFAMVWKDDRDSNDEIYFARLSSDGSKINSTDVRVTNDSYESRSPDIAWNGSEYGVCWTDDVWGSVNTLHFARLSAEGNKQGGSLNFSYYPGNSSWDCSIVWTGREYGISWVDNRDGNNEIYYTRISADGNKIGSEMRITNVSQNCYAPSVASRGLDVGISWYDARDGHDEIYFSRVGPVYSDKDGDGLNEDSEYFWGTDPCNIDSDGDGLTDGEEVNTYSSSPLLVDTDGDGLSDNNEVNTYGTDPTLTDTDGDGLSDYEEINTYGTSPLLSDTDSDGLSDYDELNTHNTDPTLADTDGDGLTDSEEINIHMTDPDLVDTDGDGLWDGEEILIYQTSPFDTDSDDDGLTDGDETNLYGTDPLIKDTDGDGMADWLEVLYSSDATMTDADGDGISDSEEFLYWLTDPMVADTDGDGMDDGWESLFACLDPLLADAGDDPDGDGVSNQVEYGNSTDPCTIIDTDGDGMSDWWEDQYACVDSGVQDLTGDPDGDGRTNMDEFNDRTDPCVSNLVSPLARLVSYQGRLTDSAGLAIGGTVGMAFSLFDGETGGSLLWIEYHTVNVENGIYNVMLGGDTVIPSSALSLPELYLEISVEGEILVPRQKITAALHAINADLIDGKRLETGTRTLNVDTASQTTMRVFFEQAFSEPPRVTVSCLDGNIGPETFVGTRIYNVTELGFDVEWKSLSGTSFSGSANFSYHAFGE